MFFRRALLPVWKLTGFPPESYRPSPGFQTSLTWTSIRPHLGFNQALFARQSGTSSQRVCNLLKIRIPTTCFLRTWKPVGIRIPRPLRRILFYLHRQPSFLPAENCERQKSYDRTRPGEESSHHSSPGLPYIIRCQPDQRSHCSGFSLAVSLRSWNCRMPLLPTVPMVCPVPTFCPLPTLTEPRLA